jgi:hypothetical protein
MSGGKGPFTTPGEVAQARRALDLPADAPEMVVKASVLLRLGLADELIAEAEAVVAAEWQYLEFALRFGWEPE